MNLKEFKKQLLKDPKIKKEFEKHDLAFEISMMIFEARIKRGLTQTQLARKSKTKQCSIARAENGTNLLSLSFLDKLAKAMGYKVIIKFIEVKK